jgi:hypothetical protein
MEIPRETTPATSLAGKNVTLRSFHAVTKRRRPCSGVTGRRGEGFDVTRQRNPPRGHLFRNVYGFRTFRDTAYMRRVRRTVPAGDACRAVDLL